MLLVNLALSIAHASAKVQLPHATRLTTAYNSASREALTCTLDDPHLPPDVSSLTIQRPRRFAQPPPRRGGNVLCCFHWVGMVMGVEAWGPGRMGGVGCLIEEPVKAVLGRF